MSARSSQNVLTWVTSCVKNEEVVLRDEIVAKVYNLLNRLLAIYLPNDYLEKHFQP